MRKAIAALTVGIIILSLLTPALALSQRSEDRLQDLHNKVSDSSRRLSYAIDMLHEQIFLSMMRLESRIGGLYNRLETPEDYR